MPTNSVTSERQVKLTPREVEVLALIAQGYSPATVADALFLSKRTIEFHLANVYKKLVVSDRVHAVDAARRLGFLPN